MKPVWKWVIGIVVALVVVAALVGGFFLVRNYLPLRHVVVTAQRVQPGQGQQIPNFGSRNNRYPGFGMPYGMRGFGMRGFGMQPFGGLVGGLFMLGLLALIVLGIIWLVRVLSSPRPAAVQPAVETHACPKCGKPVQADWPYCPNCGKKQ